MPQAMTLNLKLTGVKQLQTAIKQLNQSLLGLNRTLGATATRINQTANKLIVAATKIKQSIKTKPGPPPIIGSLKKSGGGGGGGSGGGSGPTSLGSLLFSLFTGQLSVLGAKLASRMTDTFIHGKLFPAIKGGPKVPGAAVNQVIEHFIELAGKIALVILAFSLLIAAISALAAHISKTIAEQSKLFNAGFGNTGYGKAKGIAAALNMDPDEVANAIRSEPGGVNTLVNKLNNMRSMDPTSAENYAKMNPELQPFLDRNIRDLPNDKWNDAIGNNENMSGSDRRAGVEFNNALGQLHNLFTNLTLAAGPLLLVFSSFIRYWTIMGKILTFGAIGLSDAFKWVEDFIHNKMNAKDETADKHKKAADKFKDAVDKFTDRIGTFGGGERAQNAIPRAYSWYQNQNKLIGHANSMGGFEF